MGVFGVDANGEEMDGDGETVDGVVGFVVVGRLRDDFGFGVLAAASFFASFSSFLFFTGVGLL